MNISSFAAKFSSKEANRNFSGNHQKIKRKYLQLYLNELFYKLNRRYFGERIFDRLVIANITGWWLITDIQTYNYEE